MSDEWITISTAAVLDTMRARIEKLQTGLRDALERVTGVLHPAPDVDRPLPTTQDYLDTLQELDARLQSLGSQLEGLADAAHVLRTVPRDDDKRTDNLSAVGATRTPAGLPDQGTTITLSDMSPTSIHRMSEIATSLKVTDQQALERCIATQYFVDSKLRDKWQFFMRRGRERRAVTFPGQAAI